jgi:hypothetical protein
MHDNVTQVQIAAISDLQRVLTASGAEVIETELAIPHVHTRVDDHRAISDPAFPYGRRCSPRTGCAGRTGAPGTSGNGAAAPQHRRKRPPKTP